MTEPLESATERKFRLAIRRAGGQCIKLVPSEAGIPDRLVLLPGGRIRLVELKRDRTSRIRPDQEVFANRAKLLGIDVAFLAGWDACRLWLASEGIVS